MKKSSKYPKAPAFGVYDHYPGRSSQYPKGSPSEFHFPKVDFKEFSNGQVIAKSSAKDPQAPLIVTSGVLSCDQYKGAKTGFTSTYNFRMLLNSMDSSMKRVGYTDLSMSYITSIANWHSSPPSWGGMHVFLRYQTSNDLYVASLRYDGKVTIKKKVNGTYTTLKVGEFGQPKAGETFHLNFKAEGNLLTFYVNEEMVLQTTDNSLSWGTTGIRMDYSDQFIDYINVSDV